jgi:hypothetical protein
MLLASVAGKRANIAAQKTATDTALDAVTKLTLRITPDGRIGVGRAVETSCPK